MSSISNHFKYIYLKYLKRINTPKKLILFSVKRSRESVILEDGDKHNGLKELNSCANRVAGFLLKLGLKKNDRIGVLLKNSTEFLILRLAAYKTGLVFCALIDDFDNGQIREKIEELEFRAFVSDRDITSILDSLPPEAIPKLLVESGGGESSRGAIMFSTLLEHTNDLEPKIDVRPDDVTAIGFTSGTTGKSKGVVWEQKVLLNSFYNFLLNMPLSSGKAVMLQFLPFSTVASLSILPWLASGGKMILLEKFNPGRIAEIISLKRVTHLSMAPSFLFELWDYCRGNNRKHDFSSLRSISVGSSPLAGNKLVELISFFGPIITQGYGMAEVLAPLASLRIDNPLLESDKLLSVGKPVKQVKIKIIQKDQTGIGIIAVKSNTVSLGYQTSQGLLKSSFQDGWFVTDDLGYFSEDGFLYIKGRRKNLVKKDDNFIYIRDLEELLHKIPGVLEVAVIWDDKKVSAYVSPQSNSPLSVSQIKSYLDGFNDTECKFDEIKIVPKLARSSSGKILRDKLIF